MSDSDMSAVATDPENKFYYIEYDPREQWIRVRLTGFWPLATSRAFAARLRLFILENRKHFGSARLLMDRRGSPVQSMEVAALIKELTSALFGARDHVAVIVDSSLNQMQLRRVVTHEGTRIFNNIGEAEAWLRENR
jgi:hypothetical protein